MRKLNVFWVTILILLTPAVASCHERGRERVHPDELTAQMSGRFFASLSEISTEFASLGYRFTISEPEPPILLPEIKSNDVKISEVEKGYYLLLEHPKGAKVYRFVVYKTFKGYYLQADIGVKNPYQA